MLEATFLAYLPDPFHVGKSAYFILGDNRAITVSAQQIATNRQPIICSGASELIEQLKQDGAPLPHTIVDIEMARKLIVGLPKNEGSRKHWDTWAVLKRHSRDPSDLSVFKSIFTSQCDRDEVEETERLVVSYLLALREAWIDTCRLLKEEGEYERFTTLELRTQQLLYHRQLKGIRIDSSALSHQFEAIRNEKYVAYVRVANALGVSPSGFTYRSVKNHLADTELEEIASSAEDVSSFERQLKLAAITSELANDIVTLLRSDRELKTLSRLVGTSDRCFPEFSSVGTVTGRILVRDPYLQGLRRSYRSVLAPDPGYSLAYVDYDQFEPGILASLSQDSKLIEQYNSGDLYTQLALTVFGSKEKRSDAKRIFISFLYGMSEQRIAELVARVSGKTSNRLMDQVRAFFRQYEQVAKFRTEMVETLARDGRIGTALGGHRKRSGTGTLSRKEKRWALNQKIQGTSSLIFKEALLAISDSVGEDCILLPMHDAVLVQLKKGTVRKSKSSIKMAMEQVMADRCPGILPKLSFERFAA
ncbi:MAG: DNA polymerase [Pseudomonadota bacterium]